MPEFCSDCGRPAVGRFDIVYSHIEKGSDSVTVDSTTRQRPLCQQCGENRKVITAPPPSPP